MCHSPPELTDESRCDHGAEQPALGQRRERFDREESRHRGDWGCRRARLRRLRHRRLVLAVRRSAHCLHTACERMRPRI